MGVRGFVAIDSDDGRVADNVAIVDISFVFRSPVGTYDGRGKEGDLVIFVCTNDSPDAFGPLLSIEACKLSSSKKMATIFLKRVTFSLSEAAPR